MSILKDCPCCGGKAMFTKAIITLQPTESERMRVECTNCGLSLEDSFENVKVKWNARVNNVTELKSEDDKIKESDLCGHY